MKTLTTPLGEDYQAERITKGTDFIIGYNGDMEVFRCTGISDFAGYSISDGTWDDPKMTLDQILANQEQARKILDATQSAVNLFLDIY